MATETPSYYAIIPANVRYDNTLKANEKLMYGEITCLSQSSGKCFASNEYFAKLYGTSKETVSRWISNLSKKGYIKTQIIYKDGTKQIINRYIQINQEGIDKNVNSPIDKKVKDNNTSNNNTSNNNDLTANDVYEAYKTKIKASKKKQSSLNNITKWLKKYSKEDLLKSIDNYSTTIAGRESKYIKECSNFFGVKDESNGYFIDFIDYKQESTRIVDNIKLTSGVNMSAFDKYNKG